MIANVEQTLVQKFRALPEEKQLKVLEFVEDLEMENFSRAETTNGAEIKKEISDEEKYQLRMSLAGIGKSGKGDISQRVDEILAEGINKREGWSLP